MTLAFRFMCLILFCVGCLSLPGLARTRPSPVLDANYCLALSAANRYLAAWQSGDVETGVSLLNIQVKQAIPMDALEKVFSQPGPLGFEIGRGRILKRGRYEFPVFLVTTQPGGTHRRFSRIVVLNTGHNDWTVDKLP